MDKILIDRLEKISASNRSPIVRKIFDGMLIFFLIINFATATLVGYVVTQLYNYSLSNRWRLPVRDKQMDTLIRNQEKILLNQARIQERQDRIEIKLNTKP